MLSSFFNFVLATDLDISNGRLGSIKVGESISSIYKVFNKDICILTFTFIEILIGLFTEKDYGKN